MSEAYCDIIRRQSRLLAPNETNHPEKLGKLQGIRAVLFDIYGTLFVSASGDIGVASESARGQAALDALRAADVPDGVLRELASIRLPEAAGPTAAAGPGEAVVALLHAAIRSDHETKRAAGTDYPEVDIRQIWRRLLAERMDVARLDIERLDIERLAVEYEVRTNPVWPMPAVEELLESLTAAGMVLGVISNAQFYTPLLFSALLDRSLDDLSFDADLRYFSYRIGEAKPGEAMYRAAAGELARRRVPPGAILYVGNDMLNDIMPATRVGFRTALFAGDQRSLRLRGGDARVADIRPDLIVTELQTLAGCVTG